MALGLWFAVVYPSANLADAYIPRPIPEFPMANDARERTLSRLPVIALLMALAAGLLMVLAGFGARWGFWHFRTGFDMLKWATYLALVAAVVSVIAIAWTWPGRSRSGLRLGVMALILALGFAWIPWNWRRSARGVPPIHDITTDTERPPVFVRMLPVRTADDASNPAEYGGPEVAAFQKSAYPDIAPVALDLPPQQAFERALDAARSMGWEIVDADLAEGRIEATDETFWFGFKDDVVIRVLPAGGGSRVDVRSVSRVGKGDAGTNARRVREYIERLRLS